METHTKTRHYWRQDKAWQAELPVVDIVEEVLALALEKYNVEIIVESSRDSGCGPLPVRIVQEDIVEGEEGLEVTLSGVFAPSINQQETFTLYLALGMDEAGDAFLRRGYGETTGGNVIHLKFAQEPEQFYDSLFRVQMYHEEVGGQQYDLGQGSGFLVFACENSVTVN